MDFKDRVNKIKKVIPLKFFYEKDFDTNLRTKILSDITLNGIDKNPSILKCGILLTREQEFHLFRKYNYLRYRISKLTNTKIERLKNSGLCEIEKNISKMQDVRNIIIKCNVRLIVKPCVKHFGFDTFNTEEFFSNGYVHMIKAIDYFDYRRGYKFSTYFTNVLYRNLQRDKSKLFDSRTVFIEHDLRDLKQIEYRELNDSYNKEFIKNILSNIEIYLGKSKKDSKIRASVIEKYFGVDDGNAKTLREVGAQLGISKERVRQLIDDTINIIKQSNVSYDPLV